MDDSAQKVYLIGNFIKSTQAPTKTVSGTTYSVQSGYKEKSTSFGYSQYEGIMKCPSYKTGEEYSQQIAVNYMLDKQIWTDKFGDSTGKQAEYVQGGPTIQQYCASYKDSHPKKYLKCQITTRGLGYEKGYDVAWHENGTVGEYDSWRSGVDKGNYQIYTPGSSSEPVGMWLASPSSKGSEYVMAAWYNGDVGHYCYTGTINYMSTFSARTVGLCPLVCLKSGTKLQVNEDGYKIVP